MQMYPGWSARDNYAVHKKRKRKPKKQPQAEEAAATEEKGECPPFPLLPLYFSLLPLLSLSPSLSLSLSRFFSITVLLAHTLTFSFCPSLLPMMLLKCKFHMDRSGFTLSLLLSPFSADACQPPLSPDPNSRKCRARYGLDQQQMWCGPCRLVGALLYTLSQIHCHVYMYIHVVPYVKSLTSGYTIRFCIIVIIILFLSFPPHQTLLPAPTFLSPSSLLPALSLTSHLRRKKKCIRCSEGDGDCAPKQDDTPLEDDVMANDDGSANNSNGDTKNASNGQLPVANTTFGALVAVETTKDSSSNSQSNSTAPPPVALGNQTAAT